MLNYKLKKEVLIAMFIIVGILFIIPIISAQTSDGFTGLPNSFTPDLGYYQNFDGNEALILIDGNRYFISNNGVDYRELSTSQLNAFGIPTHYEPTVAYFHPHNGGRSIIKRGFGQAVIFNLNNGLFKFLEQDRLVENIMNIGFYHGFNKGRVILEDNTNSYIYNFQTKQWSKFPLNLIGLPNSPAEVAYFYRFSTLQDCNLVGPIGDINGDALINQEDQNSFGTLNVNDKRYGCQDINGDGILNSLDRNMIEDFKNGGNPITSSGGVDYAGIQKWYANGDVYEFNGAGNYVEISNKITGLPEGVPDTGYYDHLLDRIVLWYGIDAYVSDDGREFELFYAGSGSPKITGHIPFKTNYWINQDQEITIKIVSCDLGSMFDWTDSRGNIISDSSSLTIKESSYQPGVYFFNANCYTYLGDKDSKIFRVEIIGDNQFTLAVFPDTQEYVRNTNLEGIFTLQTTFIRDNVENMNIKFATHEGDIVNDIEDSQFDRADSSISVLDGVVPYAISPGNHDYNSDFRHILSKFYEYFPLERYELKHWWGGQKVDGENVNTYQYFDFKDKEFMMLHLEFCPTDDTLEWANQLVEENSDKLVIVTTHLYMSDDNMFTDSFDQNPCEDYVSEGNNGDEQWEKFVKNHENILGVLSGHVVTGDGIGYLASIGDNGNEVHQLLANYQSYENGGNGWLRLMIFDLEKNEVCVETYSPWLDQMDTASDQEFCFDYDFNSEESLNVKSVDNKEDSDSGSSSSRKKRSSSSSDSSSNFDQYLEENVYYDEENDVIVLGNYGTIYLDTEDQTLIARMINFFRGVFG